MRWVIIDLGRGAGIRLPYDEAIRRGLIVEEKMVRPEDAENKMRQTSENKKRRGRPRKEG
jgi:hypothetical protein